MVELKVLQAVRLKGRATPAGLVAAVDEDAESVARTIDDLSESGLLVAAATLRLSPAGRNRLDELLATERAGLDSAAMTNAYNDFHAVNAAFKALLTDWQIKAGQPNAHDDAAYDAGVIARLRGVHSAVIPLIDAVADQVPRLGAYRDRLTVALGLVEDGDTAWLARPIIDSYHTVWFELHEELIQAAGLNRHDEAQAGHAH